MSTQVAVLKLIGAATQIALTWLLVPGELGLVALAHTVLIFADLLRQGGIQPVLVQRQRRFHLWSSEAFWMSVALASVAALIVVAAAPLAAKIYDAPRLLALMLVMSLGLPLDALAMVPLAKLQLELKFGTIATLGFITTVSQLVLAVILAWFGMGPFAVVVPRLIVNLATLAWLWRSTGVRVRSRPRLSRWRFLVSDSGYMWAAGTLHAAATVGAAAVLGWQGQIDEVGRYWWAYALSMQTVALVASQLEPVLFASLSRLQHDPIRHGHAFVRSLHTLAMIVVPLSILQAVVAEPAVKLVFAERWHSAIPVLQVLSVGMTFIGISIPSASMMKSAGRFKSYFLATAWGLTIFTCLLMLAARDGRGWVLALAVSLFYFARFVINLFTALAPVHPDWRRVVTPVATTLGVGAMAGFVGLAAQGVIQGADALSLIAQLGLGAAGFCATYLCAVRLVQPGTLRETIALGRASIVAPISSQG